MAEKELKGGNFAEAARHAENCRSMPAGSDRMMPPPGPKAEPVRLNRVPDIKTSGTSTK